MIMSAITLIQLANAAKTIVIGGSIILFGGYYGGKYAKARWDEFKTHRVHVKPTHKRKIIKEGVKVPHSAKELNKFIKKQKEKK